MSYIGLNPQQQLLNTSTQFFSGDGSTLEFILGRSIASASDLDVIVGNVAQRPFVDYTATNKSLLFNDPPAGGVNNITVTFRAGALNSLNLTADAFGAGTVGAPSVYSVAANNTGFYWPDAGTVVVTTNGADRVKFTGNANSTSNTTGALQVLGGAGITGNINTSGLINFTNATDSTSVTTGALTMSGGAGIVGNLNVGGDITCVGDFTVNGTFTTTGTDALIVNDPFVFLANANPGDTFDTGVVAQYNDGTDRYTGYFRDVTDGKYKLFGNLTARPTTVVDTGDASFAYEDLVLKTLSATGNVEGTFFIGDGSQLTGISTDATRIFNGNTEVDIASINGSIVSNVDGNTITTVASSGVTVAGLISAAGNITSAANVFGGNVSTAGIVTATGNIVSAGNVSGGNLITGGAVIATANISGGNIASAGQVTAGGNIIGGNVRTTGLVSAAGDVFGNNITATTAVNASGNITGLNLLTNGLISAQGQITSGSLISASGNVTGSNINTGGQVVATGNITGGNIKTASIVIAASTITGATTISASGTVTGGNIATAGTVSAGSNITGGNIATAGTVSATGTVTGGSFTTTGTVSATGNITGANIVVSGTGAKITRSSVLIIETSAANANIQLSPNGSGTVAVIAPLSASGTVTGGNINTGGFVTAVGNVVGGNVVTNGIVSAVGAITSGATVTGGNLAAVAAITAGTTISAAGAVTGGSFATGTTVSAAGNITSVSNIAGGNILATTLIRGTTISATANVIGANVQSGTLSLSGNVLTAINSTTNITTTANITGGNLITSGLATVTGAVTAGSFATSGTISATGGVTGASFTGNGRPLTSLNATNIDTGTIADARIPSLDAGKITTGTFADARIPNLNASKITAGTLPVARGGTGVTSSTGTGSVVLSTSPTFSTQLTVPAIVKSGTNGVGNIGQSTNAFNTIFARATSALYADLAEVYAADAEYTPGTVVVFGGDHEVTVSNTVGDYRVAGVISTNPAHVMNSNMVAEFPAVVGLTGRVPTRVTGPVVKGDLMVTAANGHAQACSTPAVGTVLGKALENFDGESGVIEIAVGRM